MICFHSRLLSRARPCQNLEDTLKHLIPMGSLLLLALTQVATAQLELDVASNSGPPPQSTSETWKLEPLPELLACDICGIPNHASPNQQLFETGWTFNLNQQYASLGTGLNDKTVLDNLANQSLSSSTTQLSFGYNFSQGIGVQLMVPYLHRSYQRTFQNRLESGTVSGIGDAVLSARLSPISDFDRDSTLLWNIQLGVKLPTGNPARLVEELEHLNSDSLASSSGAAHNHDEQKMANLLHEEHDHEEQQQDANEITTSVPQLPESLVGGHDLTLGSGSVDGLIGTSLFWSSKSFFLNTGAQFLARTRGAYGYQFGNSFQWNVSPGVFLVRDDDLQLGLQFNVSGEHKNQDDLYGTVIDHTGAAYTFIGPQFFASSSEGLNALAGFDLPVSRQTTGSTLVPDYRVRLQLNWKL